MPVRIEQIVTFLGSLAPAGLAESWDNVGLLIGDRSRICDRAMTCLTISPPVVAEAIQRQVGLIITHHPLPFQPLKNITADQTAGRMLLELIEHRIAVFSAHTAYDSCSAGINQQWAEMLGLLEISSLIPAEKTLPDSKNRQPEAGAGRCGKFPFDEALHEFSVRAAKLVEVDSVKFVGSPRQAVQRVAIACGSGGSFLEIARRRGFDTLLTGEANFHACLEAEATGIGLVLVGHYASERFAMETLAKRLGRDIAGLEVFASEQERDPLKSVRTNP